MSVFVACSDQLNDYYILALQELLANEQTFTQDNQAQIPAFGYFIRSLLHKHPAVFAQNNSSGGTLHELLANRVATMQSSLLYESVSYPIFLSMCENLQVNDSTVSKFFTTVMQVVQHYKDKA